MCIGVFVQTYMICELTCMYLVSTGIGYGMVIISAVVSIYYNMIIAYAMYYMLVSFVYMDGGLPWESCENDWNTKKCRYEAMPKMVELNQTQQWTDLWGKRCVVVRHCVFIRIRLRFSKSYLTVFNKTYFLRLKI